MAAGILRESNHATTYERAKGPNDSGVAINIGPNGVHILDTLGFDRRHARSMAVVMMKVYNHENKLLVNKVSNYMEERGADWLFYHRSGLRNEFLCGSRFGGTWDTSSAVKMQWGCAVKHVVDFEPELGVLVLESGEEIQADLIMGKSTFSPSPSQSCILK